MQIWIDGSLLPVPTSSCLIGASVASLLPRASSLAKASKSERKVIIPPPADAAVKSFRPVKQWKDSGPLRLDWIAKREGERERERLRLR